MDDLRLCDIFPEIDEEELCELELEQPWVTEVFNSIEEKLYTDDLLTDVVSKNISKIENLDPEIYEFVNDMVVGDEVEVKNTPEAPVVTVSNPSNKWDPFICQDNLMNANSSETSSENLHLSPDLESNCSTSPFLSDSGVGSSGSDPSPNKRSKKSHIEREDPIETIKRSPSSEDCAVTPVSDASTNSAGRIHYVLQRGQTFIFQTDKPNGLNGQQRCKTGPAIVSLPSRVVEGSGKPVCTFALE
ncbi:unnamed protein product [Dibothriocephalus latus]|uniref:Uncharacterized protein n=1 Tax=Dibothriocephalus latus TaxID=60516 RepID=A0A3P7PLK6_DIBLA|nr:unnamed protein product [Dibothriocephalus latus]